jgi:GNAT superfamily N-acetyltransferase
VATASHITGQTGQRPQPAYAVHRTDNAACRCANFLIGGLARLVALADMTTVAVSAATQDDIQSLVASVAELFREDGGRHDSLRDLDWPARQGAAYYSALVDDRTCLLALAREGDDVIGHLIGRLHGPGGTFTGRIADLESMRVAPDFRRSGVGSLLVRHFLTWAREGGAQQASVTAYAANDAAQRFYERHGFVPKSITSRASL